MRLYRYPVGTQPTDLAPALNDLGAYPTQDAVANVQPWFAALLASEASGFDPETYDGSTPPPIGWSAYHDASWHASDGDVVLPVAVLPTELSVEALLFGPEAPARLTAAQRALLHKETPGRGPFRLVFDPTRFGG